MTIPQGEAIVAAHREDFNMLLGRQTYDIWSGSLTESAKESDGRQHKRGDEIHRHSQAEESRVGAG